MSEYYEEYLVICSSELKWLLKKFVESIARAERRWVYAFPSSYGIHFGLEGGN